MADIFLHAPHSAGPSARRPLCLVRRAPKSFPLCPSVRLFACSPVASLSDSRGMSADSRVPKTHTPLTRVHPSAGQQLGARPPSACRSPADEDAPARAWHESSPISAADQSRAQSGRQLCARAICQPAGRPRASWRDAAEIRSQLDETGGSPTRPEDRDAGAAADCRCQISACLGFDSVGASAYRAAN